MNVTLAPASEGIKGDVGPCHGGGSGVELNVALAPAADWLLTAAFEGIIGAVGGCHGKGSGVADEAPEDEGGGPCHGKDGGGLGVGGAGCMNW